MYSEKFLKSLRLDEWVKPQQPQTCLQVLTTQDQSALSVSEQAENKPPRDCLNCEHCVEEEAWCSLQKAHIEYLDAKTDCPDFKRTRFGERRGFYENGLCYFQDAEKNQETDDEWEYDI